MQDPSTTPGESVFTPLNAARTERLRFATRDVTVITGSLNVRRRGKKAVVEIGGVRFNVFGKACGLPGCLCDAYIKEVA